MAENPIGELGGQLLGNLTSSILYFGLAMIFIGAIAGVVYYFAIYRKKFDIVVKVISQREKDPAVYFDRAAILKNRTEGYKYLRLRDTKVDLPAPDYKRIVRTDKADYIELWRKSDDEFVYLSPPEINREWVLTTDGRKIPVATIEQKQVEGDISFWSLRRRKEQKGLFNQDSLLNRLLPHIPMMLAGVFMIFLTYYFMTGVPPIIAELRLLVQELRTLKGAEVTTFESWMTMLI